MGYLSLLILLVNIYSVFGCAYKDLGADHTMCKYKENACNAKTRVFTKAEANLMVKAHNDKRQRVANGQEKDQPSASNMNELVWDDELATIAQRYADQCTFSHDTNRKTKKYDTAGQNVYIKMTSSSDMKLEPENSAIAWYNEVTDPGFKSKDIKSYKFDMGTGHYTQVVWATAKAIGCGYTVYNANGWWNKLVICNYGPGGNVLGSEVYKTGKACSACPNGCSSAYNGLCK